MGKVKKSITIREEQADWIADNHINLSSLVRECIDGHREAIGDVRVGGDGDGVGDANQDD